MEECFAALQGMTRGRTLVCDGLPMEFYLRVWSVLGGELVLFLNSAFASGLIGENVAFIRDVVDFCSLSGVPATLISIDKKKSIRQVGLVFFCAPSSSPWFFFC